MKRNKWKRALAFVTGIFCALQINTISVQAADYWPEGPAVESEAAIVLEITSGTVLYEKNSQDTHYPASITKIMTTLVALENSDLNEVVTFSDAAIDNTEGSGIARDYGEQMTMEQCLYAIMLNSANECAYAVAEHVGGGDIQVFVDLMNEKAEELGCVNTHFANPHGLHDDNHYTCAYDMALIGQAAYSNETFRIITGTSRYTIPPTNKHAEETNLQNHHEMLYPFKYTKYRYDYCTGGKTGYTTVAKSTLVTFAEKDGMKLVCIVMRTTAPSHWTDTTNLLDFCFDNFQVWNISENETDYGVGDSINTGSLNGNEPFVELDKEAVVVLPKTAAFTDATSEISYNNEVSDVTGTISYSYAGHCVGSANIAKTQVEIDKFVFDNQKETEEESTTVQIKPIQIIVIVSLIVGLLAVILLIKYLFDNFYIIRHNREVQKIRKEQYRERKIRKAKRRKKRTRVWVKQQQNKNKRR